MQKSPLFKIQLEDEIKEYTQQEFEKILEVKYLDRLSFETMSLLNKIHKMTLKAGREGNLTKEQLWFGKYYENEILNNHIPDVYVKWINETKEFGLFANKNLPIRSYMGEYTGIVRKYNKKIDDRNAYCFEYSLGYKKTKYTIDAREKGSLIRFVNHHKNPNITPISVYINGVIRLIFRTNRPVKKDEELTYDYGPFYWTRREKPI
ncbi:MAG: SET domain-containing protein-lysine N-methyltransferase [Parachlamydiales bacterium]|nr:SET domain-containing protein-lysine N-methyltransferase [Parachlamydiales bacterium]